MQGGVGGGATRLPDPRVEDPGERTQDIPTTLEESQNCTNHRIYETDETWANTSCERLAHVVQFRPNLNQVEVSRDVSFTE